MKIRGKKKKILFCLSFVIFAFAGFCFAQKLEITYPQVPGVPALSETPTLPEYVRYLYNFSILISGLIAFFSLIYGGFRYIVSAGNAVTMLEAREQIGAGVTGLIILLGSYLLLTTVNPQLSILKIEKIPPLAVQGCDCTKSEDELSDICKRFCKGIIVATNNYRQLEMPIGTLIEDYALKEESLTTVQTQTEIAKYLAAQVMFKAEDLQQTLQVNCKCSNTDESCSGGCTGGDCSGDPCNNRAVIEQKKGELQSLYEALENQALTLFQVHASYKKDTLKLIIALVLMDKGLLPINYDNLLELKQMITQAGGTVEIVPLTILGDVIKSEQDSANFYYDEQANQELIQELLLYLEANIGMWDTFSDRGWGPDTSFPIAPGAQILNWPVSGSSTCLSGWYDSYDDFFYSRSGGCHRAIDISAPRGMPVYAAREGTVFRVADFGGTARLGLYVALEHSYGGTTFYTIYAHLDREKGVPVSEGDSVTTSTVIGYVDDTGASAGDHLHFSLQTGGDSVPDGVPYDPLPHFPPPSTVGMGERCPIDLFPQDPVACAPPTPIFVPEVPTGGYCSPDFLEPVWGEYAGAASCICSKESGGGDEWALNNGCLYGRSCEWSVGLFQLNIIFECPGISSPAYAACMASPSCTVTNQAALDNCAKLWGWGDPAKNSQEAFIKFRDRGFHFSPTWSTASICGLR